MSNTERTAFVVCLGLDGEGYPTIPTTVLLSPEAEAESVLPEAVREAVEDMLPDTLGPELVRVLYCPYDGEGAVEDGRNAKWCYRRAFGDWVQIGRAHV